MINKIKKLIIDGEINIKYVRYFRGFKGMPIKGFFNPENDTILINENLSPTDRITTIIHEFLHEIHPEWSENKVESTCIKLYQSLSRKDYDFFNQL